MTYELRLRPQVESDIEDAALWYEGHPIRWVFPKRFPYRIVFVVKEDIITVLCVTHAKRHERVWRERL